MTVRPADTEEPLVRLVRTLADTAAALGDLHDRIDGYLAQDPGPGVSSQATKEEKTHGI